MYVLLKSHLPTLPTLNEFPQPVNLSPTAKNSPKCLQGAECAGPPKIPKVAFHRPQGKAVQTAVHATAICSTASHIFLPHNITEAAKKTKTKPANLLICL